MTEKEREYLEKLSKRRIKRRRSAVLYIKGTASNFFISIYKKSTFKKNFNRISLYKLLKIFSSGNCGFYNRKKKSSFSAGALGVKSALFVLDNNFRYVRLIFNGLNLYKGVIARNILKTLVSNKKNKIRLLSVVETTSIPYNGCKSKKEKKR